MISSQKKVSSNSVLLQQILDRSGVTIQHQNMMIVWIQRILDNISLICERQGEISQKISKIQENQENMDKKIRKIEKDSKKVGSELKSLEKADKKRDKLVEAGKKKMKDKC